MAELPLYYNDNKHMKEGIRINEDGMTEEIYDGVSAIRNWDQRVRDLVL